MLRRASCASTVVSYAVLIASLLPPLSEAQSLTWRVPSEHPTIFGAVDSASYGDTVLVAPGRYYRERVKIIGPDLAVWIEMKDGIVLASEESAERTVLADTSSADHSVVVYCGPILGAEITGLTINGWDCPPYSYIQSAILLESSDAYVHANAIDGAESGIVVVGVPPCRGAPFILGNEIRNCRYGIKSYWPTECPGTPVMRRNMITGCDSGIWAYEASPEIDRNVLMNNGTGIEFHYSWTTYLVGNTIIANGYGVAVFIGSYDYICFPCEGTPGHANDIHDNFSYDVYVDGEATCNAAFNYWGTACPQASRFHGNVTWAPWTDATHKLVCSDCTSCGDAVEPTTWGAIKAMFR